MKDFKIRNFRLKDLVLKKNSLHLTGKVTYFYFVGIERKNIRSKQVKL